MDVRFGCIGVLSLDIWPQGGNKVLSVNVSPFRLVSFKPGPWMDIVNALAQATPAFDGAEPSQQAGRLELPDPARDAEQRPRLDLRPAPKKVWLLVVHRRDVEAGNVSELLMHLKSMSSDPWSAWAMRGRVSVTFDGYTSDLRSIFTIPEVRRFVAKVNAGWPYWFFFLNQVDHSIKLVTACLCDLQRVEPASWKLSQNDLMRFVGLGMAAMGDLGKRYRFDGAEMDAIAAGVFQYLHAELG
jgi:hypothetical protein